MSPFTPAASSLSDLSARFQDIATALASPTPGQGRTVDAVDERNSARTITLNRLADWSYTASATAREQADIDAGLERAPSPADISALAATCHATAGNDLSALAAYQEAGAERMAAKKAHAAATSATTWPEPASPAPMPTCSVDDRPIGDGYDGEGVADPAQPESDPETPVSMTEPETAPPVTMSTDAPAASATMSTISDTAAGTSLTSDTPSTDAASRTASLSSPTATAAQAPTAGQPSPTVTGPTGGAASQLGAPQNGVRQGASGRRPAQTRNEDSQPTARDTTFDAAIAGTSGTALGVVGGAHSVSGSSAGQPSTPSTSTSGAPTASPAAPSTPPSAPSGGQGAGPMGGGPMARAPMGSGSTVAPTSSTPPPTIVAAEVDPSIDPLKADPDDLDWTPPTIPEGEKKA